MDSELEKERGVRVSLVVLKVNFEMGDDFKEFCWESKCDKVYDED